MILVATLLSCFVSTQANEVQGKATMYGGNLDGNACGFKMSTVPVDAFPFGNYAAAGGEFFDNGYGCGKCARITCVGPATNNPDCFCDPDHPAVVVQVTDQCPECPTEHFDLETSVMEYIVAPNLAGTCGKIETRVEQVNCEMAGNIEIRSKSGTSAYW